MPIPNKCLDSYKCLPQTPHYINDIVHVASASRMCVCVYVRHFVLQHGDSKITLNIYIEGRSCWVPRTRKYSVLHVEVTKVHSKCTSKLQQYNHCWNTMQYLFTSSQHFQGYPDSLVGDVCTYYDQQYTVYSRHTESQQIVAGVDQPFIYLLLPGYHMTAQLGIMTYKALGCIVHESQLKAMLSLVAQSQCLT